MLRESLYRTYPLSFMGLSWVWSDSPYQSAFGIMVGVQGELTSGGVKHFLVGMPGCTLPLPCTIKWGIPWCKSHTQGRLYTLSKTPFLTITSPPPTRDPPDPTRIVCQCEKHLPAKFQHPTLKVRVTIHQHLPVSSLLLKTPKSCKCVQLSPHLTGQVNLESQK